MQTTIKNVEVEWVGSGSKKYGKAVVFHTKADGKEGKQYLVSFKNPDVFKKVQELIGQSVEVDLKKDGDFWQWTSINTVGSAPTDGTKSPGASATTTRVSGSNYETKEERAARQVLIVKQSSLSAAVATLTVNAGKDKLQAEDVLALAQTYTDWVFSKENDESGFDTMDSDLPF